MKRRAPQLADAGLPLAQYITRCQHCPQIFRSSGIPIVGTAPEQATAAFVNSLVQHVIQKHPDVMKACAVVQRDYLGLMMVSQFSSDDPEFLKQKEQARHAFFKQVQLVRISDAKIGERLKQICHEVPFGDYLAGPTTAVDIIALMALMKEFRDVLEENLQDQPQPAVVTPNETVEPETTSKPS